MSRPSHILPGHPAYDLKHHFEYLLKLRGHYPTQEENEERILALATHLLKGGMAEPLMGVMQNFCETLFYQNDIMWRDDLAATPLDRQSLIAAEDRLLDKNREDRAAIALQKFYWRFFELLPQLARQPLKRDAEGRPRLDRDAPALLLRHVVDIRAMFRLALQEISLCEDGPNKPTFYSTSHKLERNLIRAAGHSPDTYRGQSIDINKCNPDLLFTDTPFEEFLDCRIEFSIPDKYWKEHAFIAAPPGHGKTQLLQHQVLQWLSLADPPAMFIIDSQEGMLDQIQRLALFSDKLKDRLVVLDPPEPALNFFQIGDVNDAETLEIAMYLFSAIDRSLTAKQGTAIPFLLRLLKQIPDANLYTLLDIMGEPMGRNGIEDSKYKSHIAKLDQLSQTFFRNQFYHREMAATRKQVESRLFTILGAESFAKMFAAKENRYDAGRALAEKKITLINTSHRKLGQAGSSVFGAFMISQILRAAYQRGADPNHPLAMLIIDEAHEYFQDDMIERLLRQARKYGLGTLFATHYLQGMSNELRAAVLGATTIKMIGPVLHNDATIFSREMNCDPSFFRTMKSYDRSRAEWATFVRNYVDKAIRLTVPFGTLERQPKMSDAQYEAMRAANFKRYAEAPAAAASAAPDKDTPPGTPADANAAPKFIPQRGDRVAVYTASGLLWFAHGAKVVDIKIFDGHLLVFVDPTPYAQADDPAWCFEKPKTGLPLSELGPWPPKAPQSPPPPDDPTKPASF